jgi:outer membrane protein assembly factor BamB
VVGDLVVVNASDESQTIFGLDKASGKVMWKAEGEFGMAYGTPNVFTRDGVTDVVIAVPQEVWGINPESGKLRWYATHGLSGNVSPSIIPGGDVAYVFGGYPATKSTAIKLGGKGELPPESILWTSNTSSYVPTPILKDGHLYVVNDQGFATCIDAKTGTDVFRERVIQNTGGGSATAGGGRRGGGGKPFYASPVLIGDKLVCVSRKNGTYILAAKPKFEVLGHNVLSLDGSQFNGTPAVSGDLLLLRSDKAVYCIGTK